MQLKLSVGYWHHLVNAKVDSLVYFAYKANLKLNNRYASKIEQVFLKSGFQHVWENQNTFSKKRLIFAIIKKICDGFANYRRKNIFLDGNNVNGNKLRTYRKIKEEYSLESYLLAGLDKKLISNFAKIRVSNSKLLIERGRHLNIQLENRLCPLCRTEIEDEFHFTINCPELTSLRNEFFLT